MQITFAINARHKTTPSTQALFFRNFGKHCMIGVKLVVNWSDKLVEFSLLSIHRNKHKHKKREKFLAVNLVLM